MMRVFYGQAKGNAHRYQCRGDDAHVGAGLCIGIGGVRVDRAVALQILEAVSDRAVEAAILASDQVERSRKEVIAAVERELEVARYEASLAARRYELVDLAKRHVARELEARWNGTLERVAELEGGPRSCAPRRRKVSKSIAPCFCNLRMICREFGTHRPRTHAPNSDWFTSWSERLFAISTRTPMRRFYSSTGRAAGTRMLVVLA
ncbi:hypothetical protein NKH28_15485 [Mesorhizobium sp. M1227]|uniref:hypothetical protein n=1 Tax=Mesorhizobium sp. M1227 TaxID=2957071 RepID=UPI00333A9A2F